MSIVVSIVTNPTFKVKLVPMEYVQTMSKDSTFLVCDFEYTINVYNMDFCTPTNSENT